MSFEARVASAVKWVGASRVATQLLSWAATLIVVRLLSPADFGLMALAWAVVGTLGYAAELGLGASIVQAARLGDDELQRVNAAVWVASLTLCVATVLLAPVLGVLLAEPRIVPVVQLTSVQFLCLAISTVPQALLNRDLQFRGLALVEITASATSSLTTLACAWWGLGVWSLVAGLLAAALLRAAMLVRISGWIRPRFQRTGLARHLRFGGAITFSRLSWQLSSQIDVLIAGRVLGSSAAGIYSIGVNIAWLPMQKIMSALNQVAFPAAARLQGEPERLRRSVLRAVRLVACVAIPAGWGMGLVANELVAVLYGPQWLEAATPLSILSILVPARMLGSMLITAAVAQGAARTDVRNAMLSLIILPPAFLIGIRWDLAGLAWAWVLGVACTYAVVMPDVMRRLGLTARELSVAIAPSLFAGSCMAGALLVLRSTFQGLGSFGMLALLVGCGAAIFVLVMAIVDRTTWSEFTRLLRRSEA